MEKNYLTTGELAEILGISRVAVFKKIKSGQIKAVKNGRNFIIYKKDLSETLDPGLTENKKREINKSIEKTIKEYGETLKLLGKE